MEHLQPTGFCRILPFVCLHALHKRRRREMSFDKLEIQFESRRLWELVTIVWRILLRKGPGLYRSWITFPPCWRDRAVRDNQWSKSVDKRMRILVRVLSVDSSFVRSGTYVQAKKISTSKRIDFCSFFCLLKNSVSWLEGSFLKWQFYCYDHKKKFIATQNQYFGAFLVCLFCFCEKNPFFLKMIILKETLFFACLQAAIHLEIVYLNSWNIDFSKANKRGRK